MTWGENDNKDEWIVDEPAAKVVRRIFSLCVEGLGPTQIAKRLREEKVLTPTEYCGDTVNFRTTSKSFKLKKRLDKPQEEWQIFENTHPAIIDRETFELVQELRKHRRRPNRTGEISMFSGLIYCADCGEKLYYSVTNNYKREQAYFFCSAYRKNSNVCSAHYIREKVVESLVPESMQRVLWYVQTYEKSLLGHPTSLCRVPQEVIFFF